MRTLRALVANVCFCAARVAVEVGDMLADNLDVVGEALDPNKPVEKPAWYQEHLEVKGKRK